MGKGGDQLSPRFIEHMMFAMYEIANVFVKSPVDYQSKQLITNFIGHCPAR